MESLLCGNQIRGGKKMSIVASKSLRMAMVIMRWRQWNENNRCHCRNVHVCRSLKKFALVICAHYRYEDITEARFTNKNKLISLLYRHSYHYFNGNFLVEWYCMQAQQEATALHKDCEQKLCVKFFNLIKGT